MIHDFIANESPFYAQRIVERILERSGRLAQFPTSGRIVQEFNQPNIREIKEGRYRIAYRLLGDRIEVLCVWHSARQMLPRGRFL
ncbi:MAG: type II toxin-antitoxin system RelE/ParE family toxin [Flavobacteriales bacterium]|nr:type II toxin-antitoxin system RelE/ParE family toxin [Flavobacteriales bacterium]